MSTAGQTAEVRSGGYRAVIRYVPGTGAVIMAADWDSAAFGMGFQMAADRAGQMDILRRTARGTVAEVLGRTALPADIRQRRLGLVTVARRCLELLPPEETSTLNAFAQGANTALRRHGSAMTWTAVDCVHVAQVLFQSMASDGSELRMTEVMRRSLPPAVVDFLLDSADEYATDPDGRPACARSGAPLPAEHLRTLFREPPGTNPGAPVVAAARPAGSNAWAVATTDGAVLANDMHLQLSDPAVMYPVRMVVGDTCACGVTVPGLPTLIAGSNGRVAWGFTRLHGDTADLRALGPGDVARIDVRQETIGVLGEPPSTVEVRSSPYGPLAEPLAGEQVAFSSTLLDPRALDFGLLRLYRARDLDAATAVVNDCGLPPVNALLADGVGRVGWTVGGRFPRRGRSGPRGLSGASGSWCPGWIAPHELPRVVSPASGVVVNCNNGSDAVRDAGIAWNLPSGVRARRVAASVGSHGGGATAARALQMDADASFYEFYRDLALRHLPSAPRTEALREIRADIAAWGGTAGVRERGLALLTVFRELLHEELIAAATRPARRLDQEFTYCFAGAEAPVRRLLGALSDGLVPAPWRNDREFVAGQLLIARRRLLRDSGLDRLPRWGEVNRLSLVPLALYPPDALDLELSGCAETVCVAMPDFGAAMRLVVHLGEPSDSSIAVPGGPREREPMTGPIMSWARGHAEPLYPMA